MHMTVTDRRTDTQTDRQSDIESSNFNFLLIIKSLLISLLDPVLFCSVLFCSVLFCSVRSVCLIVHHTSLLLSHSLTDTYSTVHKNHANLNISLSKNIELCVVKAALHGYICGLEKRKELTELLTHFMV
jgi:hypothetical protein